MNHRGEGMRGTMQVIENNHVLCPTQSAYDNALERNSRFLPDGLRRATAQSAEDRRILLLRQNLGQAAKYRLRTA
jgi:hypothetical protein